MKKFVIAIPCVITGLLLGAMTPTHAAPLPSQDPPQYQQQSAKRHNVVSLNKFDGGQEMYGCFPGLSLTDCIGSPSTFDNDSVFKLLAGPGLLHCGPTPMAVGSTCAYSQAEYGLNCGAQCGSPTIAADQTYVDLANP